MRSRARLHVITLIGSVCLAACAGSGTAPAPQLPTTSAPEACSGRAAEDAVALKLRPTSSADGTFAQRIEIDRALTRGRWHEAGDGWSARTLALYSKGARSLSAHLVELKLPTRTEIWWCSPDGGRRHGPYREAAGGSLWTPVVDGERALLQVWVPSVLRADFAGTLADVQGGY